jgi:hypothetical protein
MYKEIGNSIYGSLVRGMNNKLKLNNKTGEMSRIPAHFLSNPIISSWVTGFIRSIIGECLHSIHQLGGKIVSVTTDGFITDIIDLESKLNGVLFSVFKNLRRDISGDPNALGLELKHSGVGVIS